MSLIKTFFVAVYSNGTRHPCVIVDPPQYNMLYELGRGELSILSNVRESVARLHKVIEGELDCHIVSGGDWCIVTVRKKEALIENGFGEFEPLTIPSQEILLLMEEWLQFLSAYESGKIPGIIPKSKQEEWVIVPKEFVKEEYWKNPDKHV